jgi:hypothetical protein
MCYGSTFPELSARSSHQERYGDLLNSLPGIACTSSSPQIGLLYAYKPSPSDSETYPWTPTVSDPAAIGVFNGHYSELLNPLQQKRIWREQDSSTMWDQDLSFLPIFDRRTIDNQDAFLDAWDHESRGREFGSEDRFPHAANWADGTSGSLNRVDELAGDQPLVTDTFGIHFDFDFGSRGF